jgi:tol-pal system protein YbgF
MPADLDPDAGRPVEPQAGRLTPPTTPASPAAYYRQATLYYASGQYELAIEAFADFVTRFPAAPQAAEAQFFIGEAHYQSGRYKEALDAFVVVATIDEASEYVPGALYRQGVCHEQLDETEKAIALYQRLRVEHPQVAAGARATQALVRLGIIKGEDGRRERWGA